MADFAETMRQLFGLGVDPTTGTVRPVAATGIPTLRTPNAAYPTPPAPETGLTGVPGTPTITPQASTPGGGRVLATLNRGRAGGLATPAASAGGAEGGGMLAGLGGDLAAAGAAAQPGMSPGNAFLAGFAATQKHREEQAAHAQLQALAQRKAQLDAYKTLFDMQNTATTQQYNAAKEKATETRQARQDEETKRWHNIMAPQYNKKTDTGETDWTAPDNLAKKAQIQRQQAQLFGADPVSIRQARSLMDKSYDPAEKARIQQSIDDARQNYKQWDAAQPWSAKPGKTPTTTPAAGAMPGGAGGTAGAGVTSAAPAASSDDEEDTATPAPKPGTTSKAPVAAPPVGAPTGQASQPVQPPAAEFNPPPTKPGVLDPAIAAARGGLGALQGAAANVPTDIGSSGYGPDQAVKQNPAAWRPYRSKDGTLKLFNPQTGESQPMQGNQADFQQ